MPPVMGAAAFIMAEFLGIEYAVIIVAAAIPSIAYYLGLLMQVDAYAARSGLQGLPREELPSIRQTLKEGWPFIAVILFLIWGLLYMRWESRAPWFASGLMFFLSFARRETMMTPRRIVNTMVSIGNLVVRTTGIVIPMGFIVAGLTATGVSGSFTAGIIRLGGDNPFLILLLGVVTCYILGMAGLVTPAYIFLALTLAPAVLKVAPLNPLAIHLFIMYYAMLANITPPVAGGAFIAATMAGAHPMRTAWMAMRLGIVIYFIPFFFVFNPALVLQGSFLETIYLFALVIVGIVLIAGGFEGYLIKFGLVKWWARPLLVISGLLIGFPEWISTISGAILALIVLAFLFMVKSRRTIVEKIGVSP